MSGVEVYVGAAIAAIGAGVSTYAQQTALQKQYNATAAGIAEQNRLNSQANQQVQQTIQKLTTNQQQSEQQTAAQQTQAYKAALAQAANAVPSGVQSLSGASKQYKNLVANTNAADANFANTQAGVAGAATAPGITAMQNQEALTQGETGLGLLEGQSQQQNYLTQLAVASQQANPWLTAAGQTAEGAGEGMVSSGIMSDLYNPTAAATPTSEVPASSVLGNGGGTMGPTAGYTLNVPSTANVVPGAGSGNLYVQTPKGLFGG